MKGPAMEDDEAAPKPKSARKPRKAPAPARPAAPPAAAAAAETLSRKALFDRVSTAVGGKKGTVKDIVEATLQVLGDALRAGESLNLPPLGKARVAKAGAMAADGKPAAMTIKLRAATAASGTGKVAKEALAEAGEEG